MQFIDKNSLVSRSNENLDFVKHLLRFLDVKYAVHRLLGYTADQAFLVPPVLVFWVFCTAVVLVVIGLLYLLAASVLAPRRRDESGRSPSGLPRKARLMGTKEILGILKKVFFMYPTVIFIFLAVFLCAYTLALVFPDFQIWTQRAFFLLYPFFAIIVASVLFCLHSRLKIPAILLVLIVGVLFVRGYGVVRTPFLFRKGYEKLKPTVKNADVIFVLDSDDSIMRLPNFCVPLSNAKRVYMVSVEHPSYRNEIMKALDTADKGTKVMIINTIGGPPTNSHAISLLGRDLLLTGDNALVAAIESRGYHLTIVKKAGQLFQWFNLYKLVQG
jgi:hypothetical protein